MLNFMTSLPKVYIKNINLILFFFSSNTTFLLKLTLNYVILTKKENIISTLKLVY
jgi:hypothetical protein